VLLSERNITGYPISVSLSQTLTEAPNNLLLIPWQGSITLGNTGVTLSNNLYEEANETKSSLINRIIII
jgi:hypothetical protein